MPTYATANSVDQPNACKLNVQLRRLRLLIGRNSIRFLKLNVACLRVPNALTFPLFFMELILV